jgi:ankyrin repeat protein
VTVEPDGTDLIFEVIKSSVLSPDFLSVLDLFHPTSLDQKRLAEAVNSRVSGNTALTQAIRDQFPNRVARLMTMQVIDPNVPDGDGRTPLSLACELGNVEIVRLVLADKRVDVNLQDADGNCPLRWAVLQGREDVIEVLIKLLLPVRHIEVDLALQDLQTQMEKLFRSKPNLLYANQLHYQGIAQCPAKMSLDQWRNKS